MSQHKQALHISKQQFERETSSQQSKINTYISGRVLIMVRNQT